MNAAGKRVRLLTWFIIGYLLLAFAWWSVLLYTKNKDAFEAKAELLRIGMAAENLYGSEALFRRTPQFRALQKKYQRQEYMILGEASLFIASLVIGIWLMNRGYLKELQLVQQQRNFLLSITHELKSPLAGIRLVLDTFRRRQLTPDQVQLLAGNGLKDTERLNVLVNNLLLAARIEDSYQVTREPVSLNELARQAAEEVRIRHKDAAIQVEAEPDIWIEADRQGIHIVLINLIENAVKYSPGQARIDLHISRSQGDGQARIEITDHGLGIPDKEKEKVFLKFYRIGSEDTRSTKGTGLGLYIVKGILDAHKADIALADNKPAGTRFTITFPKLKTT